MGPNLKQPWYEERRSSSSRPGQTPPEEIPEQEKRQAVAWLMGQLEAGRISGEREGLLSTEEIRAHFLRKKEEAACML